MEEEVVIRSLMALAQSVRLRVFRALVVAGPQGMTPGALTETLGVPATGLSFHLKELGRAGLVSQERQGRHLIDLAQAAREPFQFAGRGTRGAGGAGQGGLPVGLAAARTVARMRGVIVGGRRMLLEAQQQFVGVFFALGRGGEHAMSFGWPPARDAGAMGL